MISNRFRVNSIKLNGASGSFILLWCIETQFMTAWGLKDRVLIKVHCYNQLKVFLLMIFFQHWSFMLSVWKKIMPSVFTNTRKNKILFFFLVFVKMDGITFYFTCKLMRETRQFVSKDSNADFISVLWVWIKRQCCNTIFVFCFLIENFSSHKIKEASVICLCTIKKKSKN